MDWTCQIKAGKGSVSVHFTCGALTAYGVTPAKYSTANPFFQHVIEDSDAFKSGRIRILDEMEVADDAAAFARKPRASAALPEEGQGTREESPAAEGGDAQEAAGNAVQPALREEDGRAVVEVPDKYEAIEYLKERYPEKGYTSSSLRTKASFDAACAECGVAFVFTT